MIMDRNIFAIARMLRISFFISSLSVFRLVYYSFRVRRKVKKVEITLSDEGV